MRLCTYVCACHSTPVEFRWQLAGVSSFLQLKLRSSGLVATFIHQPMSLGHGVYTYIWYMWYTFVHTSTQMHTDTQKGSSHLAQVGWCSLYRPRWPGTHGNPLLSLQSFLDYRHDPSHTCFMPQMMSWRDSWFSVWLYVSCSIECVLMSVNRTCCWVDMQLFVNPWQLFLHLSVRVMSP